jgi:hypothetical protein
MGTALSGRVDQIREEFSQLSILTRHFFGRLFRNDIVDFEDQMKSRLIAVLSVLAVIMGWSSQMLMFKYTFAPDANISWQEKNYIFVLMMIIFGIVTLLEWEMLFPDRQDFLNLRPLPVRLRTFLCAKLASFILFVGLFSVAMSSVASVLFAINLGPWRSNSPLFVLRYVFAHLISAFAACFCVFFACVFVQFFLMAVLPFGIYRRTSLLIRFVLITVFVFFLLAFLVEPSVLSHSFHSLARLKDFGAPFVFRFPPLWFVGLYEVLLGNHDPFFSTQARTAGLAFLFSVIAFMLASGLSYYRHVSKTLESKKGRPRIFGLWERAAGLVQSAVFWTPEERAMAGFFSKTVRSSPKHRMALTNYLAVATGFVLLLFAVNRRGSETLTPENANLLVQPLILTMVMLMGIRSVVNIPAAPEARWVFQVTETARRGRYVSGLKKAILFKWFVPLSVLVFFGYLLMWRDWQSAFNHAVFGLTVSVLGIEGFFFRYRKVPFACPNVPGRLKLQTRGIPYLLGFISLLAMLSAVEKGLLRDPSKFIIFFAFSLLIWAALRVGSVRFLRTHPLIYEEEAELALVTFPEDV